jgi:ribulose-phosphate 3-epimerase
MGGMPELPIKIAASVLLADYSRLGDELRALEDAGCDLVQWDVMDGHFVPQITFGPALIEKCRSATSMEFEAQLMIERPELTAGDYVTAGCSRVIVHAESSPHVHRAIDAIHHVGATAGIALNPATPIAAAEAVLAEVDQILIMTIDPGAAGRPFQETSLARIASARAIAAGRNVEVDGGIDPETARRAAAAGANVFVAASSIFHGLYKETVAALRQGAESGRRGAKSV